MGRARVLPIVIERLRLSTPRLALVAATQDNHWCRWGELLGEVAAHLLLVTQLMTHDENLRKRGCGGPLGPMGVEYKGELQSQAEGSGGCMGPKTKKTRSA